MKRYLFPLIAIGLLFSSDTSAQDADVARIHKVIQKYLDGTSQGKPELIRQAFLPSLELQTVRDGKLVRYKGNDYIKLFKKGERHNRVGRVISIDVSNHAAVAKAEVIMDGTVYIDYFLLLELDSGWRIANKIATRLK